MKSTTIDTDNFNGNYGPGDIVSIVSGGPAMTVVDVCPDCGDTALVRKGADLICDTCGVRAEGDLTG